MHRRPSALREASPRQHLSIVPLAPGPCLHALLLTRTLSLQSGLPRLDLTVLTRELAVADMVITRATVYPSRAHRGFTEHRMWVAENSATATPGRGSGDAVRSPSKGEPARSPSTGGGGAAGRPDHLRLAAACARAGLQPRPKPPTPDARQTSGAVEFVVAEGSERWAVASGGSSSSGTRTAAS